MKKLLRRIRYWIGSRRANSELAEEMELHRSLKQQSLERSGLSPADAAAESRRELGNVLRAREESRDVWGWTWIDDTIRDTAYACRAIIKMPVLAVVVVASLGIGIGVNATVFSWIQRMVLQPIPGVAHPSSFYLVEPRAETGSYPGSSWLEYNDLRQSLRSFRELIAFRMAPLNVGERDRLERRSALLISDNYFSGLGLQPALGHFPRPGENVTEVVISDGFWNARFDRNSNIVGQTLRINDQIFTIAGVTPAGFQGTVLALDFDLWIPARLAPILFSGTRELEDRGQRGYTLTGRLQEGVAVGQAQTELNGAMQQLAQVYPEVNGKIEGEILAFWRAPRGPQRFLAYGLAALQGLMLLLLLAVCGNTANLLLARAASRSREIGTRLAIGATRWRVVRLMMTESLLLGILSAGLGVAIAVWGTDAIRATTFTMAFPIRFQTSVDGTGLLFSILLGVGCAALFGAAPAFQLVRGDPHAKLRSNAPAAPPPRLRKSLMAIEASLALMVLMAAALFFESFQDTRTMDPGFQVEGVLLSAYDLSGGSAGHFQSTGRVDPAYSRSFADKLLDRLGTIQGVESAAIASYIPLDIHGFPMTSFRMPENVETNASPVRGLINFVTPDYFRTMNIPMLEGPGFAPISDTTSSPQVVVNQEFVRRFIADQEPIGRRFKAGNTESVIAGVAKNSFYDSFGEAPIPIIYFSYRDRPRSSGEIHLRTKPGAESLFAGEIRRAVRELDPGLPVFNVRTLSEHIESNLFLRRIPARLFVVLGPLLLFFAAIGIYSVVAYNVAHRMTEMGIRMALGATANNLVAQVVRETMKVIAYGALAGVLIAFVVYIHVVPGGPINLVVFAGVPAVLLLVAAVACWLPARRTANVDPMIALRRDF